jgi:hypothetical protein
VALFVIERTFAEQLELTGADIGLIEEINADEGVPDDPERAAWDVVPQNIRSGREAARCLFS